MADPRVLQPSTSEFYKRSTLMPDFYHTQATPPGGWPPRDSPEKVLKALNEAHAKVRMLIRVNDVLRRDQGELISLVKNLRRWRWGILTSLLLIILEAVLKR